MISWSRKTSNKAKNFIEFQVSSLNATLPVFWIQFPNNFQHWSHNKFSIIAHYQYLASALTLKQFRLADNVLGRRETKDFDAYFIEFHCESRIFFKPSSEKIKSLQDDDARTSESAPAGSSNARRSSVTECSSASSKYSATVFEPPVCISRKFT